MLAHAVIFDMDGLLLDTEKVCLESFVETRRIFSLPDDPEIFLRCVGIRGLETEQVIRGSLDGRVDFRAFNDKWSELIEAQLSIGISLKEGADQLVQILASKGHLMGVATSTKTQVARSHLERCGLLRHFQVVVGGDLVEKGKPDPEVYHKVAEHLGAKIVDCIAFEDSETGTKAAMASGARTIQVPDLFPVSADFAKRGQIVAANLLAGALEIGLITGSDI